MPRVIDVFASYIASSRWRNLQPSSKKAYMAGFKDLEPFYGRELKSIKRIELFEFFEEEFEGKGGKATMARNIFYNIYRHAVYCNYVPLNLIKDIDINYKQTPFKRWSEQDVDIFLSTAEPYLRSAFLLALYTGQRKSDLVRMTWDDYDGKYIKVKQRKTGKQLSIPVHPKLRADLENRRGKPQTKGRNLPFIILNRYGTAWTFESLRRAITNHAKSVGLVDKTVHGIRKTTASILAESGCTPFQIMSITGHRSMREVVRYTAEANQVKLANEAMKAWEEHYG